MNNFLCFTSTTQNLVLKSAHWFCLCMWVCDHVYVFSGEIYIELFDSVIMAMAHHYPLHDLMLCFFHFWIPLSALLLYFLLECSSRVILFNQRVVWTWAFFVTEFVLKLLYRYLKQTAISRVSLVMCGGFIPLFVKYFLWITSTRWWLVTVSCH